MVSETVLVQPSLNLFPDNPGVHDIVHLDECGISYDGGKTWVIENQTIRIEDDPDGSIITMMGTSGCGKSTLLNFITGNQTPTRGTVNLYQRPRVDADVVGMVFQKYSNFDFMTVLQNVEFPLKLQGVPKLEREERAMAMLKLVGLETHASKYAKQPGLSGGQMQRVAIARCLVSNPKLFVMDEPFGALDGKTRLEMQLLLLKIQRDLKANIILVTHDASEAVFLGQELWIMASNPGRVVHRIGVDLPKAGTEEDKTTEQFRHFVNTVDGLIRQL